MKMPWDPIYILDVEINFWDMLVISFDLLFILIVAALFIYYSATERKKLPEGVALASFCNLGEGATSKFFTIKGGRESMPKKKQGGKGIGNKDGKYAGTSQTEIKCNYCKSPFFLSAKKK
eukprot:TRINITY_DN12316_c0_g5_i1.p2 TRINITY_DN12316_c0_g5~~TRINITY_DN12316_c0_g5_i1.p2  ORF type:complete len:120 (+),score=43.77 TRINITY_DN12316_c0_g5_i1:125-484(+)